MFGWTNFTQLWLGPVVLVYTLLCVCVTEVKVSWCPKDFSSKCFQSLTFISKLFPGVLTLFLLLRVSGDLKESPNQSILGVQSFGLAGLHCL